MKKFLLGLFILSCLSFNKTFAQGPKLGHINSAELMQMMTGVKEANDKLEAYQKALEDQLRSMYTEFQTKSGDYDAKKGLMPDAVREQKEKELDQLQKNIQEFQQTAQEKINAKREELLSPISKKAEQAIKEVAKENNYTYIFDSSLGVLIYAFDSFDIMDLVKKKLNIVTPAPGANLDPKAGMTPIPATPKKQ